MIISQKFKNRYKKALLLTEIYNLKKKSNSTIPFFIVYRNCRVVSANTDLKLFLDGYCGRQEGIGQTYSIKNTQYFILV